MKNGFVYMLSGVLILGLLIGPRLYHVYLALTHPFAQLDAVPLSPANYQPAALELVKLCQSDPSFYSDKAVGYMDPFDPVWAPPSVTKLHPEDMLVEADHATVYWGGGLYHCGWTIERDSATADGSGHTWTLSFFSEAQPNNKVLKTIDVKNDQRLTEDEYVGQVLAEFDRRLASQYDDGMSSSEAGGYLAASRCLFLEKHHRVNLLPAEVRKAAANYPHDWRDVLLGYLLDHNAGDMSAGEKLRHWANQTNCPAAWMYAAYAFYQAGDAAGGDDAIKKAAAITSADPDWMDKYVPEFELGMAKRLYESGHFSGCVSFCDGIFKSPHRYFNTRSSVQRVRDDAASTAASRPAQLPEFDKYTSLDPFGGFDLNLLLTSTTSSQRSTTQP